MRFNHLKSTLKIAVLAVTVLLLGAGLAVGQQQINLTAGPTSITLPDGSAVPMWGYTCGAVVSGSTATCANLNPAAAGWSPVVITVPTGQTLQINLTNNLSFANGNTVPTSLTIVGQVGGGLGTGATSTPSPTHATQTLTWPAASSSTADGANTPPPQGPRVQSFSTEVAAGATTALTWTTPRAGTYLLESGTHPSIQGPMGLFGMVVVTTAPSGGAGTAYPGVSYNAEIPLLFSEIDPVQNRAVNTAVNTAGFSETMVWSGQAGGCGNPSSSTYNQCYPPAVNYSPRYYLINGVAFDKTNATASLFPTAPATGVAGTVLVRMVNAGLRMHIPSIVGAQTGASVPGFGLIAEDGNPLPGVTRVQSEVFMAPGKTYDVTINVPASGTALPIFDRQGSLSSNATGRDAGMLAYISVNGATLPAAPVFVPAAANPDTYNAVVSGKTLVVSDPAKGVIANDVNVYGVAVVGSVPGLNLNTDGTFTYTGAPTSFTYCGNGTTVGPACALVTLGAAILEAGTDITVNPDAYTSNVATTLSIKSPGVLDNDSDAGGYPLSIPTSGPDVPVPSAGLTLSVDSTGAFTASVASPGTYTFTYKAQNSQGVVSSASATVTLTFPAPSNLQVAVVDGLDQSAVTDYRWIIEEDRTFYVDPNCQANPLPAGCPTVTSAGAPAFYGTNFHTSYMPVVAQGCVGTASCEGGQTVLEGGAHLPAACDIGNGVCRTGVSTKAELNPSQVVLDPTKHYYISVLPGDAMDPGHAMGGAQIAPGQTDVTVLVEPEEQPPAKVSVFVFEDDHPLNGEQDAGGGIDVLSPNEPGLGGFNITIQDLVGMSGDSAGQLTFDEFNQPLSNALAGSIDPVTGLDACPIVKTPFAGVDENGLPSVSSVGITGVIPVCPQYEADGKTLSPLAGQAIVANMPPGRYGIVATPAADRIARGEEWLQTNTLDGGKDHESFLKAAEPAYFQEFGPAGFHVAIGFANPQWIKDQGTALCNGPGAPSCSQTVQGKVTGVHMSRTPDQRLYSSETRDTFGYTQCYASLGSPDGADIAFAKCAADGTFVLSGIPAGDWRLTIFDQWNDQIVDGISTPVRVGGSTNATLCHGPGSNGTTCDMGDVAVHAWKNNLSTRTFFDLNGDGVSQDNEQGLTFVPTNVRYRDGSISNLNSTDLEGFAGFNEVFPIFNWYVVETDSNRYKNTGIHVINDAGGPVDNSSVCGQTGFPPCGNSSLMANLARTAEDFPVPTNLRIPGAVYCDNADCSGFSISNPPADGGPGGSTGRIDPPSVNSYGWQSFMGQNQYLEFGKKPFAPGENGGIRGHVVYASTRPFDDPALLLQLTWEPQVPHVKINLYQEGVAADGVTPTLTLVDTTETSSWDDWAQGFRSDGVPNMNCPGQSTTDPFFYTLQDQPSYLDWYNAQHGGPAVTALPNNSQFKCYDGMHMWNQLQPAPYDGMYQFPSVTGINPTTGKPSGTNCTVCQPNTVAAPTDWNYGLPMLPAGKYVVEMVVPPGYELVKEEDKNILLGDTYEAPVTTQFAGFGNIFIMPDQASVAATYNPNNPLIPNTDLGALPRHEGDTGSVETFWPCVGALRVVPDYNSLFPGALQNAPFAGASRRLCDRKEVTLEDQMSVLAKFYVFTSTHVAAKFTGIITDDFTSEFDPFSPAFGEKFSPANMPIGVRDWAGNEISRIYADQHGIYNGMVFSTFSVNPPDPSGYIPNMMVMCMNDRGSGVTPDPFYQDAYSQFCYEWSFMPGQTSYLDTPVIPTSAFAPEYNHPDCNYPDATPAIKQVDGDGVGPWVGVGAGSVASLTPGAPGIGYTSAGFSFTMNQSGGTGATGQVTDLKLVGIFNFTCSGSGTNACSNFPTNPAVTIQGGGGSGATATATKSGTTISFVVTNGGSGYTSRPTVMIRRNNGTLLSLTNGTSSGARMGVNGVALTASGSGYTSGFTASISGGGGSGATAIATLGTSSQQLTITALGDQDVNNYGYSGPSVSTSPYNQKRITRHYGFGSTQGTGTVTIGGVAASVNSWSDTQIVVTLPANAQVPLCPVQQQAQYGGSPARCGELVITADNGKRSVDTVTVTIGGKAPTRVTPGPGAIQSAIDAADPGDLIIVPPGNYHELLLMWKPVRLQGVGAASSIIDANAHPSGLLNDWRLRVVCLFGLAPSGVPAGYDSSCGAGWNHFVPTASNPQVDRLPLEATVGWDAGLNGNLAEQLQEPTLMGAYEGAGITVLSKGVRVPNGLDPWSDGAEPGGFPAGTALLTNSNQDCGSNGSNPFPSSFQCNPSSIDGLAITNSSQGGGGIFVHGWAHNLQIANNRVYNNQGTLAGGISIGQGEHPGAYLAGGTIPDPGSCQTSNVTNLQLPYCFNRFVNVHHNAITQNASEGDELFAATPSGAGGVAICSGADNYLFNYNWVCGNLSTGDGAGVSQMGFVWNGQIQHNTIIFNQATNPTTPSNGGGLLVMSAPDTDPTCPGEPDADCPHAFGTVGDGIGPGLVINANLIMGNAAEAGSGGGIRFQGVNGTEVSFFPTTPSRWFSVDVTNNIIANNVAGWDGGGVSLQDSLVVNLVNNTIISNDSTASSGTLFGAFFAPLASSPTPCPTDSTGASTRCVPLSTPQPAGISSAGHTAEFLASLPATIVCPANHGAGGTGSGGLTNGACRRVSFPIIYNDVLWQNRAFNIVVATPGSGELQSTVTLVPQLNQSSTGACVTTGANYWDIGLRGDTGPTNHSSGFTFTPHASVLTDITGYPGTGSGFRGNTASFSPGVVRQYCNGSKRPPEAGSNGWYNVPPGTNEGNVPVPVFNLTAGATVDEGNNWINISWGPLSLITPASETNPSSETLLGDYSLAAGSTAINYITNANSSTTYAAAPANDFFDNARKTNNAVDVGAVEFGATGGGGGGSTATATLTPSSWNATCSGTLGCGLLAPTQVFTLTNTGNVALTGITQATLSGTNANQWTITRVLSTCGPSGNGQILGLTTLAPGASCVVTVRFTPTTTGPKGPATLSVTDSAGTQSSTLTGTRN
jgi:hypothetical protein